MNFWHLVLIPTHDVSIVLALCFGYLFANRWIFSRCIILTSFVLIFNFWLKSIWQIPLNPSVHSLTWAFPSGHMHIYMAFVGWLAWEYRTPWILTIATLGGLATAHALVACGYHDYPAVAASICIGLTEIALYNYINQKISFQKLPFLGMALAAIGWLLILDLPHIFPIGWVWQSEWILLMFSCCLWIKQILPKQANVEKTWLHSVTQGSLLTMGLYSLMLSQTHWGIYLFIAYLTLGIEPISNWIASNTQLLLKRNQKATAP